MIGLRSARFPAPALISALGAIAAALTSILPVAGAVESASVGEETSTTGQRTEVPASIAVIGDSISQGTGANGPGSPGGSIGSSRLAASWATGDHPGLESYADRLETLRGVPVERVNLSANGASMQRDFVDQAQRVPAGTDLVLVQMGGNDLCRQSEEDITPAEEFRTAFRTGLEWIATHRPNTLVMVSSIPDIYALWYVRGAPHRGEQYPVLGFIVSGRDGPRAPRSMAENNNKRAARLLWDTIGVVPCRTMLFRPNIPRNAGPTPDPSNSAEQRRLRVRARTIGFNQILAEECARMLRCRFDDHAVFDFVSNRGADGVLLADKEQWRFVDADISTQDHFHPSFAGQRKLAEQAWTSGYDWTDRAAPTVVVERRPSPTVTGPVGSDWYGGPVRIEATASDPAGIRGLEYRYRATPNDQATRWQAAHDDQLSLRISEPGRTVVEIRALDWNGNLSESQLVTVRVDREAPTLEVSSPRHRAEVLLGERMLVEYRCADQDTVVVRCEGTTSSGMRLDTATVGEHRFVLEAVDLVGHHAQVEHVYSVRYRWSGMAPPLVAGQDRRIHSGVMLPIRFLLTDADGRPAPEADAEVVIRDQRGREHPWQSIWAWLGEARLQRSTEGVHVALVDTRGWDPGVWDVIIRPDDGTEYRVNLLVENGRPEHR